MSEQGSGFSTGNFLLSFSVGGLIGAGVVLLTAPKKEGKIRRMIKELSAEVKGKAGDCVWSG
jgi:gas vesicle protein